jgi:type I restriction enzyme S subunit
MNVQRVSLGSIAAIISGGTPTKSRPEYWNGSIPWISAKTMKTAKISTSNLFISEEGLFAGSKLAPIGSLLILTRGSELFNRVPICYVTSEVAFNQDVKCIIPTEAVDSQFLYYALINKRKYLSEKVGVTGIGAGKLETDILQNIEIDLPTKADQQRIVKQIKQYDCKIDLNVLHIKTLIMSLQALYQSWFYDFKLPNVTGKMHDNIPVGWTNSNVFENVTEVREKNKDNCDYPVLSVVKEGEFKLSDDVFTKQVYSKETTNYKIIRRNQVAYNPARANIGSIAMLTNFDSGLVSPIYVVFEMKETITPTFFYYYMKQPMFIEGIKHHAIGTTRQNFPFEAFKMFPMVVPPMELQKSFEEIAKPIEMKIAKLKEENVVLAEIRDTLLPKLMNGELPVEAGEA